MATNRFDLRRFIIISFVFFLYQCSFTKNVKTGEMAYERKQYAVAVDLLKEEYDKSKSQNQRAEVSFLLGKSYNYLLNFDEATYWFREAVDNRKGAEAIKELAFSFKRIENYKGAIGAFKKLKAEGGNDRLVDREIGVCADAISQRRAAVDDEFRIESMGFNSKYNEYSSVLYDKNYIVFTADIEDAIGNETYNWTGNKFSDLFIIEKNGSSNIQLFDDQLNSINNEGTSCFSKDFQQIYFTRCESTLGDDYCRIMWAGRKGNGWTDPVDLYDGAESMNYGQPTLIENDSVLIFSSNQNVAESGYDLYYSVLDIDGWSLPEAMPESINTPGDERFPSSDGDTLYFSSDYHPGLGGLDIFKTYLKRGGTWSKPQNVGYPLNRGSDDFGLVIDRTIPAFGKLKMQGFFSSNRNADSGDDIFRFSKYQVEEIIAPKDSNEVVEAPIAKNIRLALRVGEYVFEDPDNPKSKKIAKDPVRKQDIKVSSIDSSFVISTDEKGRAFSDLNSDTDYTFTVKKEGYLFTSMTLSTKLIDEFELQSDTTLNKEILIERIIRNKEIVLDNIYYDYNKADIREDAKPGLDYLVGLMRNNPDLNIQLSSHTDCRGFDDYNLNLSQKRAESAVAYIVSQGVSASKMKAVGYGETIPAVQCDCLSCSEEEHQINRRTTFKVVE